MSTGELITVQELAKRLNVPVSWIYRRTRLGQEAIPHACPERLRRYVGGVEGLKRGSMCGLIRAGSLSFGKKTRSDSWVEAVG